MIAIVMIPGVLCEGCVTPYTLMKCMCVAGGGGRGGAGCRRVLYIVVNSS